MRFGAVDMIGLEHMFQPENSVLLVELRALGLQDGSLAAFGWQSGSERALGPGPWDAVWRLVFGKPANGWWGLTAGPINANAVPALAFAGATADSRGNAWLGDPGCNGLILFRPARPAARY